MDLRNFQNNNNSLLPYTDGADFDYAAFLYNSEDELNFLDSTNQAIIGNAFSDSSTGRATPPSSDNNVSTAVHTTNHHIIRRVSPHRLRVERRGHTKSRRGCYNCKRRRIKVFPQVCHKASRIGE